MGKLAVEEKGSSGDKSSEVELNGPPEPIVRDDGSTIVLLPKGSERTGGGPLTSVKVGEWVCQMCSNEHHLGLDRNGKLIEPYKCPSCERQGPFQHAGGVSDDDIQSAMVAGKEWVVPPSDVTDERIEDLWDDIREYISTYWCAKDEIDYELLTAWVTTTWLRPELRESAHLMLMGKTAGGKTRLLNTLSRLSYRGGVTVDMTPAAMFRHIDTYDSTQFISEYHGLNVDAKHQINNVVRGGQKRDEYVRRADESSAGGYQSTSYNPFTHVAIASQYIPPDDIVNRCVQIQTRNADAPDLPRAQCDDEATDITNRLLFVRWRLLESERFEEAFTEADCYCNENGIKGRTKEKVRPLLAAATLWGKKERFGQVVEKMVEDDDEAHADSEDANIIAAIRNLASGELAVDGVVLGKDEDLWASMELPYSDIVREYNNMTGEDRESRWLGHALKRLGIEKDRKRDGTVVSDSELKEKLERFCEMYDFDLYDSDDIHNPIMEMPEKDHHKGDCSECGERRLLTMKHIEGHTICMDCATSYDERREA